MIVVTRKSSNLNAECSGRLLNVKVVGIMAGNVVQTIMADRMLQDFEGDRSYQWELTLLRRQENCIL